MSADRNVTDRAGREGVEARLRDRRPSLLTTAEAAAGLKVSPRTLDNWRSLGTGPEFIKVGALVRYREDDIEDYLDRQTRSMVGRSRSAR